VVQEMTAAKRSVVSSGTAPGMPPDDDDDEHCLDVENRVKVHRWASENPTRQLQTRRARQRKEELCLRAGKFR